MFFIFLVANIGGSLTPLGDPPLFLGFLKGVSFFWTTSAMLMPMIMVVCYLIIIYFLMDSYYYKKEDLPLTSSQEDGKDQKLGLKGSFNLLLLLGVISSVLLSGFWRPHIHYTVHHVPIELQNLTRDILLLLLAFVSWKVTPQKIREANEYTWFPIVEVA